MDILYFLKMRTRFIKGFYKSTSFPFTERKRRIEVGEEPFVPPYSEDGDPPFLDEWIEADESIDVLGQTCICMVATALYLYLKEWIDRLYRFYGDDKLVKKIGRPEDNKTAFKKGWINGYRIFFGEKLKIIWEQAPSNLGLLEEIVLTRNRAQHPEDISTLRIEQSDKYFRKHLRSFFADDLQMQMVSDPERPEEEWVLRPWRWKRRPTPRQRKYVSFCPGTCADARGIRRLANAKNPCGPKLPRTSPLHGRLIRINQ